MSFCVRTNKTTNESLKQWSHMNPVLSVKHNTSFTSFVCNNDHVLYSRLLLHTPVICLYALHNIDILLPGGKRSETNQWNPSFHYYSRLINLSPCIAVSCEDSIKLSEKSRCIKVRRLVLKQRIGTGVFVMKYVVNDGTIFNLNR